MANDRIYPSGGFQSSTVDTRYAGESGRAAWQQDTDVTARGFGTIVDLAVAVANDVAFGEIVAEASAAMTVPKLKLLRAQAGEALGLWGETLELTRANDNLRSVFQAAA